ncbi:MAG: hypothetical protein HY337_03975 [Gemmatimonadetes bacterium]|nr:hypothetical protein [Gemmatimonadota bacterium]
MTLTPLARSTYPFHGGPWDGFIIEYGERSRPDDSVNPRADDRRGDGMYHLNDGETAYVWTNASRPRDSR